MVFLKRIASLTLVLMVSTWGQAEPISELVQKRLAMGDKANRLIHEHSPYLLQHAFNPVDWYPWGEEAFARARKEDKPVFLSVGYSTCHWCHVMEEESFEHAEIAAILNRWFICIKVDREERPDIDQMYMAATQAMTGSGGWPMSVFLFPDGKPFYAGTYFPPEAKYGRPGFADVLTAIHEAWSTRRSDLAGVAEQLVDELAKKNRGLGNAKLAENIADMAYLEFENAFNPDYGGFNRAPKFPRPVQYNFLLRYWHQTGKDKARDMVINTLRHMGAGGIYDHVGGGFHRYATDGQWRVPHFEKMLYDQAQLASSYLDAYLITGDHYFADIASDTMQYVLRDMRDPAGGFFSAEDADSDDPYSEGQRGEGAFYLWTAKDVAGLLPGRDGDIFIASYGILAEGNAPEDPQGEFKGRNILYRARPTEDIASQYRLTPEEVDKRLHKAREVVRKKRSQRKRPHLDDKVLVAWNGLMIGSLARGSAILASPELVEAATKAARFIKKTLYDAASKNLLRRYRQGESGLAGQLDDYAFLVAGLLELYQATQEPEWLQWAVALTETQIEKFWDQEQGGFFDSVGDATLPIPMKGDYDGAEPAGNSVAAMNLLLLGTLTGNKEWSEMGSRCIAAFSTMLNTHPGAMPQMLTAWQQAQSKPRQVVIAGPADSKDTWKLIATAYSVFSPGMIVLLADEGPNQKYLAQHLPFIADMGMLNQQPTAYVCQDFACQMPVNSVDALTKQLRHSKSTTETR